jgi:hypothetical protein
MKTKLLTNRFASFVMGVTIMGIVSFVTTSSAQNPSVKLLMRFGEERVLEDGTKIGVSKGDGDLIVVTLSRPLSNASSNATSTTRPTSNQSFQQRDFLGTWECYEVPADYQSGSGRFPPTLHPALLVKYFNNGVGQSASPEDRRFTSPMSTTNWEYIAQTDTSGVMVIRILGTIGARLRVRWIDENTYEDEILYSNEPAYIGIKRVFKRVRS